MSKPTYLKVPEGQWFLSDKEKWQKNYIPFAGYLSFKYGGLRHAWDEILTRYVRMKGVVWPDEFEAFYLLFANKHPEFMGSTRIKNDRSEYSDFGCYWDYSRRRHKNLFGRGGLFYGKPISPKPEKRDKVFLDLVGNEMYAIKKGWVNAINKRD